MRILGSIKRLWLTSHGVTPTVLVARSGTTGGKEAAAALGSLLVSGTHSNFAALLVIAVVALVNVAVVRRTIPVMSSAVVLLAERVFLVVAIVTLIVAVVALVGRDGVPLRIVVMSSAVVPLSGGVVALRGTVVAMPLLPFVLRCRIVLRVEVLDLRPVDVVHDHKVIVLVVDPSILANLKSLRALEVGLSFPFLSFILSLGTLTPSTSSTSGTSSSNNSLDHLVDILLSTIVRVCILNSSWRRGSIEGRNSGLASLFLLGLQIVRLGVRLFLRLLLVGVGSEAAVVRAEKEVGDGRLVGADE